MFCPFCRADETKVIDSRLMADGNQVKRRRECAHCGERFNTHETVELTMPRVIKRNGNRESFNEKKFKEGFYKSLEKRPLTQASIDAALTEIMQSIHAKGESEMSTKAIGDLVMKKLYLLDHVAYVRFASVYKNFKDIHDFGDAITQIKKTEESA